MRCIVQLLVLAVVACAESRDVKGQVKIKKNSQDSLDAKPHVAYIPLDELTDKLISKLVQKLSSKALKVSQPEAPSLGPEQDVDLEDTLFTKPGKMDIPSGTGTKGKKGPVIPYIPP
eukprot:gnl/MRDRNA2_/MRDRNA2_110190_c0_seq1.p1 gnl/MRDRNA2_/MRDRNA2_110190_c0~~gnl/MRDRNA2_/MRDRNA2_110190_c0_seq1.p1  ORF type:complete len:117 (-),score=20.21 gnl/MRDRNA2_/MRDRNA2_110190_c0_seq1:5-355(-)